jgi:signal transduction histidine kinase
MDAQIDEPMRARIARPDLVQVLANVLRHAVEASEGSPRFGWVTITADRVPERGVIELAVRDNGAGIPPHLLKRCFEPGEITRVGDDGQALGLAIVRAIVEARGGSVRALSEPDRGTTVVITLPAA